MIIDVHAHVLRWPILKKTNSDRPFANVILSGETMSWSALPGTARADITVFGNQ